MKKSTLLLLDGHNLFIRSFSGLMRQGLSAPDGSGTWGIFGAFNVMANLIRRHEPSHVLIAFDQGRSSKRLAIDPEYKANRNRPRDPGRPMDNAFSLEFKPQLQSFMDLCTKNGLPHMRLDNVEADDIIATAALSLAPVFEKVVIVSADHDLHQLIRENIIVVKPSISYRDIEEEIYDTQTVMNEWGVEPWRLAEIWALMGDKGDNVKGIPGVGPKKATKLIADLGSLDKVLESDDPKIASNIDVVKKAKLLIELGVDKELPFPPLGNLQFNPIEPGQPGSEYLIELFDELGFVQLKDRWKHGNLWRDTQQFGRKLR
jgi:DNA polymerase-1